jgi:hypothetical protein
MARRFAFTKDRRRVTNRPEADLNSATTAFKVGPEGRTFRSSADFTRPAAEMSSGAAGADSVG